MSAVMNENQVGELLDSWQISMDHRGKVDSQLDFIATEMSYLGLSDIRSLVSGEVLLESFFRRTEAYHEELPEAFLHIAKLRSENDFEAITDYVNEDITYLNYLRRIHYVAAATHRFLHWRTYGKGSQEGVMKACESFLEAFDIVSADKHIPRRRILELEKPVASMRRGLSAPLGRDRNAHRALLSMIDFAWPDFPISGNITDNIHSCEWWSIAIRIANVA